MSSTEAGQTAWTVPVYHPSGIRPQVDARPPWRAALRVTSNWAEFVSQGERAVCEVLIVRELADWELWEDFVAHQRGHTLTPRILVTTLSPDNFRRTISVVLHELLWLDDSCRVDLTEALTRASTEGLLFRCASLFAAADGLPIELRAAFVIACHCQPAVQRVERLAELASKDRRTIWTRWRKCVGPSPAPGLKDTLDRIVLLRAIRRRHAGERWSRIVRDLGVSRGVLDDQAKARLGKSLGALTIEDAEEIVRFLEGVLLGSWPGSGPAGYSPFNDSMGSTLEARLAGR